MTLGYHSKDIAQGEKQSNKKEKQGHKKNSIQIQGRKLGVHVDSLRILKLLLKKIALEVGGNEVLWFSQTPNKLKTIIQ